MPYHNYPNNIAFDFLKKMVWHYNHLPVGKFRTQESPQAFAKLFRDALENGLLQKAYPAEYMREQTETGIWQKAQSGLSRMYLLLYFYMYYQLRYKESGIPPTPFPRTRE
jgi:hypothetical protein